MRELSDLFHFHAAVGEPDEDLLDNRVVELEAENLSLRQLEETIRRNMHLFDAVLRKSRDGIALLTPDLTILRLIRAVAGYEEADLLGQSLFSLIHPADAPSAATSLSRLLTGDLKTVTCEFRARHKDGTWVWVEAELTDLLDDPDVQAIVLNHRDVTSQRANLQSAEIMDALRKAPEYAFFSESPEGEILDWSLGAEAIFGYSAEEAVGQNVSMLLPADLLYEAPAAREKILSGEMLPPYDTCRIRKDGQRTAIRLSLAPVQGADGTIRAIAHISHAISEPR